MSALVSARDWRLRSMAICVSSLEDRTCSTAVLVLKRTSEVRAVIQRTCEPALFVSSLATCYPQFIFWQRWKPSLPVAKSTCARRFPEDRAVFSTGHMKYQCWPPNPCCRLACQHDGTLGNAIWRGVTLREAGGPNAGPLRSTRSGRCHRLRNLGHAFF